MSDQLQRMVGQIDGKLDSLTTLVRDYIAAHDERHKVIDEQISDVHAEINQAKGRRGILVTISGIIGGVIVAALQRMWR